MLGQITFSFIFIFFFLFWVIYLWGIFLLSSTSRTLLSFSNSYFFHFFFFWVVVVVVVVVLFFFIITGRNQQTQRRVTDGFFVLILSVYIFGRLQHIFHPSYPSNTTSVPFLCLVFKFSTTKLLSVLFIQKEKETENLKKKKRAFVITCSPFTSLCPLNSSPT